MFYKKEFESLIFTGVKILRDYNIYGKRVIVKL